LGLEKSAMCSRHRASRSRCGRGASRGREEGGPHPSPHSRFGAAEHARPPRPRVPEQHLLDFGGADRRGGRPAPRSRSLLRFPLRREGKPVGGRRRPIGGSSRQEKARRVRRFQEQRHRTEGDPWRAPTRGFPSRPRHEPHVAAHADSRPVLAVGQKILAARVARHRHLDTLCGNPPDEQRSRLRRGWARDRRGGLGKGAVIVIGALAWPRFCAQPRTAWIFQSGARKSARIHSGHRP